MPQRELYGIALDLVDGVRSFEGSFDLVNKGKVEVMEGNLRTRYGTANLRGVLEQPELVLTETYDDRCPTVYKFKFDKTSGMYIGEFRDLQTGAGRAFCRLDNRLTSVEIEDITEGFETAARAVQKAFCGADCGKSCTAGRS